MSDEAIVGTPPKDWGDLEVVKRTLTIGTAGELDAPAIDIPPYATGKATITWSTGGRKETPQKDGQSVKVTTTLVVDTVIIDTKSIVVPEPEAQLPGMESGKNRKKGDTTTAGEATAGVVEDLSKRRGQGTMKATRPAKKV